MLKKAVQQGRSRRTGRRRTLLGYVEDLFKARTKLVDFFSILLTTLLLRLLMCPGERSDRVGKVGLPESQDQVRVL